MNGAALLAAALFAPSGSPGAGFSATRTHRGVLIVFEPYELHEQAKGALTLETRSGPVRIALRGHGVDTIVPRVTVETPRGAAAGRPLTIRFAATDNDLVRSCSIEIAGRAVAHSLWPVSTFRWQVPRGLRGRITIRVVAIDRAGNRGSATSGAFSIRRR
jgi:hypothetical protein